MNAIIFLASIFVFGVGVGFLIAARVWNRALELARKEWERDTLIVLSFRGGVVLRSSVRDLRDLHNLKGGPTAMLGMGFDSVRVEGGAE